MGALALDADITPGRTTVRREPLRCGDPFEADRPGDEAVATTGRGLARLALVAAETGAHFQREAMGGDPLAWLLTPRDLFDGRPALLACLDRDHCGRAILLHGLSLGDDVHPTALAGMLTDQPLGGSNRNPREGWRRRVLARPEREGCQRLYSTVLEVVRGREVLNAFHASLAPSTAVVRERLRARFGSAAADQAEIRAGFDPTCPTAVGLVPPLLLATLRSAARSGRMDRWIGLDITIEQRRPS